MPYYYYYYYEATIDDMSWASMKIANYHGLLKCGLYMERDQIMHLWSWSHYSYGRSKLIEKAMKSFASVEDVNTMSCALEGFEIFGSKMRKLDIPPRFEYNFQSPVKVNYSIPHPYTRLTKPAPRSPIRVLTMGLLMIHVSLQLVLMEHHLPSKSKRQC